MPLQHKVSLEGAWGKANKILSGLGSGKLKAAQDRAVLQEAHEFRKAVMDGIRTQAPGGQPFTPLAPMTIAKRKLTRGRSSSKALIDTADMLNSIEIQRRGDAQIVGIARNKRTRGGKSILSIAMVHENGATIRIRVTEKMRRFFFAMLRQLGGSVSGGPKGRRRSGGGTGGFRVGSTLVIRIPPRPFFRPVVQERFGDQSKARARFLGKVAKNLAAMGWRP